MPGIFLLFLALAINLVYGFPVAPAKSLKAHKRLVPKLSSAEGYDVVSDKERLSRGLSSTMQVGSALLTSVMLGKALATQPAFAAASKPVVILGASGKTGKQIVDVLTQELNTPVIPTYAREKKDKLNKDSEFLLSAKIQDVTNIETLDFTGAQCVIFAASASSKGGNAEKVDFLGVENVAKACIAQSVPRLIVISSAAVTRPNSLGFKITNLFGNIMNFKLQGEDALRSLYANTDKDVSYAIVRPGGLLDGPAVGAANIELNQGDCIAGEINRSDVAALVAAAAVSTSLPKAVTFECYAKGKGAPLEKGLPQPTGYEITKATYENAFAGLKSNFFRL